MINNMKRKKIRHLLIEHERRQLHIISNKDEFGLREESDERVESTLSKKRRLIDNYSRYGLQITSSPLLTRKMYLKKSSNAPVVLSLEITQSEINSGKKNLRLEILLKCRLCLPHHLLPFECQFVTLSSTQFLGAIRFRRLEDTIDLEVFLHRDNVRILRILHVTARGKIQYKIAYSHIS